MDSRLAFGELRSLIAGPPSAQSWQKICHLLEGWEPEHLYEEALPYAQGALGSWPSRLRVCPRPWLKRAFSAQAPEALSICAVLCHHEGDLGTELISQLAATKDLSQLEVLDLNFERFWELEELPGYRNCNMIGDQALIALADRFDLKKLTALGLRGNLFDGDPSDGVAISDLGVEALVGSASIHNLEQLDLSYNAIGQASIDLLANASSMRGLQRLGFCLVRANSQAFASLLQAKELESLKAIRCHGFNYFGHEPLWSAEHFEGPRKAQLEEIELGWFHASGRPLYWLVQGAESLKRLSLTQEDGFFLEELPAEISRLESLCFTGCSPYDPEHWRTLHELGSWEKLHSFSFCGSNEYEGVLVFLQSPAAARLEHLSLEGCSFSDPEEIAQLLANPKLEGLKSLDLSGNDLSAGGASAVAQYIGALSCLETLCLDDCNLESQGLQILEKASWPSTLAELRVGEGSWRREPRQSGEQQFLEVVGDKFGVIFERRSRFPRGILKY